MNFNAGSEPADNEKVMLDIIETVKTANVTYAVRDTEASGKEIKTGDILGITGGNIEFVGSSADEICKELVDSLVDDDSEFITVYYGSDVNEESAEKLAEELEEKYDDAEVLLKCGNQPLYYYIVSVE